MTFPLREGLKTEIYGRLAGQTKAAAMNIGEAAKASGVSAKMIRHYEQTALINPVGRTGSNYRVYGSTDIEILHFVKQARHLGFSIKQIATMLELWQNRSRPSDEVESLINQHLAELDSRIREMTAMKETVENLAGTLPPFSASFCMTSRCNQTFIAPESSVFPE
ncbi:MerR family DNA-binding protein [Paraburkholderia sp. RL17-373-BIF-A]|uniref:MerR family DNA-binding protein n=1 Tax=Paraburkholderia sp. RL17-373-BIF-A TaxID=3031629 RepID=UPI0038B94DE6